MRCRLFPVLAVNAWAVLLTLAPGIADAQASLLTDLGPGDAAGINNSGQVVLATGIWSNGTFTAFPAGFSGAAINSSGQVAGTLVSSGNIGSAAFYSAGTVTLIGANSDPTIATSAALGISDNGVVVGQGNASGDSYYYGFICCGTAKFTALGTFPGSVAVGQLVSEAYGVNDAGQVTGIALNDSGLNVTLDAFVYDINTATWTDLGPGGGLAINASGQVLLGGEIYSNGKRTPIPIQGVAINNSAQVVGGKFFYSGGIIDLNALVSATDPLKPFVTLTNAVGINDTLLIAVNGVDSRTQINHAYLVQAPWITMSPGPLTFPGQVIGTVSPAQVVTVTNRGTAQLALDSVATGGDFSQSNNCGASLAPGGACTIMVTFHPTAAGDRTDNLTVTTTGVPVNVPLAGTSPIQITISSSAMAVITGTPVKLTWKASPGATCKATGGSSADGWTGNIATSGTQSVVESTTGNYLYGLACTAGSQSQSNQTLVEVTWPVLTVSLTASPTTITSGKSTMLTWASAHATTCLASGGGTDDGWTGTTRATAGSAAITEPVVVASPLSLTFTLTCSNSDTGQSTPASAKVVLNPPANSGGGGALDPLSVLLLAGAAAMRRHRNLRDRSRRQS